MGLIKALGSADDAQLLGGNTANAYPSALADMRIR
jgi:hypothetical protein